MAQALLQRREAIADLLQLNALKGRQRLTEEAAEAQVTAATERVAACRPVLDAYLAGIALDVPVDAWGGEQCAAFIYNVGLPRYAEAFERNLSGARLFELSITQLPQLGVNEWSHQQALLRALEQVRHALGALDEQRTALEARDRLLASANAAAPRTRVAPPPSALAARAAGFGKGKGAADAAARMALLDALPADESGSFKGVVLGAGGGDTGVSPRAPRRGDASPRGVTWPGGSTARAARLASSAARQHAAGGGAARVAPAGLATMVTAAAKVATAATEATARPRAAQHEVHDHLLAQQHQLQQVPAVSGGEGPPHAAPAEAQASFVLAAAAAAAADAAADDAADDTAATAVGASNARALLRRPQSAPQRAPSAATTAQHGALEELLIVMPQATGEPPPALTDMLQSGTAAVRRPQTARARTGAAAPGGMPASLPVASIPSAHGAERRVGRSVGAWDALGLTGRDSSSESVAGAGGSGGGSQDDGGVARRPASARARMEGGAGEEEGRGASLLPTGMTLDGYTAPAAGSAIHVRKLLPTGHSAHGGGVKDARGWSPYMKHLYMMQSPRVLPPRPPPPRPPQGPRGRPPPRELSGAYYAPAPRRGGRGAPPPSQPPSEQPTWAAVAAEGRKT